MRPKQLIVIGAALGIPELLEKYLEPPTKVASGRFARKTQGVKVQ